MLDAVGEEDDEPVEHRLDVDGRVDVEAQLAPVPRLPGLVEVGDRGDPAVVGARKGVAVALARPLGSRSFKIIESLLR